MAYKFKLPDVGEGLVEAEILSWLVKEGQEVKVDDPLVEIQNDKSTMEITTPVSGTVEKILVPEGMAQVDEIILTILTEDDSAPSEEGGASTEAAPKATEEKVAEEPAAAPAAKKGLVRAVPSVRKYAREKGVDINEVTPADGNRLTRTDIDNFLSGGGAAEVAPAASTTPAASTPKPAPVPQPQGEDWREPMTPVRKAIANGMVQSRTQIPHVTVFDKVDATKLIAHRNEYKGVAKEEGIGLTFLPYVVKAMVAMLKAHPSMNAYVDMEKSEIVHRGNINIGIATNTDHGLYVPVIKNADKKSIFEIAQEISDLGEKALAGKLTRDDMTGSSVTITNIGGVPDTEGIWSTPIINYPESCIMGIARIGDEVVPNEDREIVVKPILRTSFAFDHRLVDGVEAQKAFNVFKNALRDPALMLLRA